MSSNNRAKWTRIARFGNTFPEAVPETLAFLDKALDKTNKVINVIEKAAKLVARLITSPIDVIGIITKTILDVFMKLVKETITLGGAMIVITPTKRSRKRYINILSDKNPFYVPAMTPREAFNELKASFTNTKDPFRPKWGSTIKATGFGILLSFPTPDGLVKVIRGFNEFIDLKDFKELADDYTSTLNQIEEDIKSQGKDTVEKPLFSISNVNFRTKKTGKIGNITFDYAVPQYEGELPTPHWVGLDITNFVFIDVFLKKMDEITENITRINDSNSKAAQDLVDAIFKRIKKLRDLVKIVYDAVSSLMIELDSTGIWIFTIPPDIGGVSYIMTAIENSIRSAVPTDNSIEVINALDSVNFSALFFAGASAGVNLDAWNNLISGSFEKMAESINAEFALEQPNMNFTVVPDPTDRIYPFGTELNLKVVMSNPDPDVRYSFRIFDDKGNVLSKNTDFSNASGIPNVSRYKVPFIKPNVGSNERIGTIKYTLEITLTQVGTGAIYAPVVKNYNFYVSDVITDYNGVIDNNGSPVNVTFPDGSSGIIIIIDNTAPSGGVPIGTVYVGEGGTYELGDIISQLGDNITIIYQGTDGEFLEIPLINNKGYEVRYYVVLPLPSKTIITNLPAKICIDVEGALLFRKKGDSEFTLIPLPSCFEIKEEGIYEYYYYTDATGWIGPKEINVMVGVQDRNNIC